MSLVQNGIVIWLLGPAVWQPALVNTSEPERNNSNTRKISLDYLNGQNLFD